MTPVAVSADSLATWFVPVLREAAGWADTTLDLHVEDEDHSSRLLRQGDVLGAVTSDPTPVSGCRAERLGFLRYVPVAAPALRRRFTTEAGVDWAAMPVLEFNAKDDLQRRALRSRGVDRPPPTHTVPSSKGFLAAVRAGLGWGMVPEIRLGTNLVDGSLVLLEDHAHHDVALHWQTWALNSERPRPLTAAVRTAGRWPAVRPGIRVSRAASRRPPVHAGPEPDRRRRRPPRWLLRRVGRPVRPPAARWRGPTARSGRGTPACVTGLRPAPPREGPEDPGQEPDGWGAHPVTNTYATGKTRSTAIRTATEPVKRTRPTAPPGTRPNRRRRSTTTSGSRPRGGCT